MQRTIYDFLFEHYDDPMDPLNPMDEVDCLICETLSVSETGFFDDIKWREIMNGSHEERRLFNNVKIAINQWDPLCSGIDDEYEIEIGYISYFIKTNPEVQCDELSKIIHHIMEEELGGISDFENPEDYIPLATTILAEIN